MALLMRGAGGAFLIAAWLAGPAVAPAAADTSLEYAVKAAYLVKFAPFIEWPDGAFSSPAAPLTICVAGNDPFGADLDRAVQGQHDGEHPLTVRRMNTPDPQAPCQILFVGGPAEAAEMDPYKTQPVLTVTDAGKGAQGIVSFVVVGDHVRFDIDQARADAAGLHISSKLLGLAHAVKTGARP